MIYGILFEKITDPDFPKGYYYAHVPTLGLTTHGLGIEGARTAAEDLIRCGFPRKMQITNPSATGGVRALQVQILFIQNPCSLSVNYMDFR